MAEMVLGKTNLFSSCHQHNQQQQQQQQQQQVSAYPRSYYGSGRRCVLVRPLALRSSSLRSNFYGRKLVLERPGGVPKRWKISSHSSTSAQMNLRIGKQQKWWEKGVQPNMREVGSAQELVDSLVKAGDKLVIVDFFSPGCGGCRALHPKICQIAEQNPEVQFLQVNYEEHKSMCYSLNVHVLPFFRFYRGASGRTCSFSCTNATIKKFRDALAKHTPARCSLGPAKGLEEKELLALAANKDLSFTYKPKTPQPAVEEMVVAETAPSKYIADLPLPRPLTAFKSAKDYVQKFLVAADR